MQFLLDLLKNLFAKSGSNTSSSADSTQSLDIDQEAEIAVLKHRCDELVMNVKGALKRINALEKEVYVLKEKARSQ